MRSLLAEELQRELPTAVSELAAQLAGRADGAAAAVLFYGSNLRDARLDGVLDFYVLLDRVGAWPGSRLAALANWLLPPNVGYIEATVEGHALRAKYALISVAQFRRGVSPDALDTTLWARFSQPSCCAWARSDADREVATDAVRQAVITAASWAADLGPVHGDALSFWRALFAHTYAAELRVEKGSRGDDLVARDAERYARLLPQAWRAAGMAFEASAAGQLAPRLSPSSRAAAVRRWAVRRRLGKPLNIARLLKAAFTFDGAMDYAMWKVERHSGVRPEVTEWQRRHPLLAAPGLYRRLRKLNVLR
ncbi:MAG: hypothetical protein CFE40_01655 [Burkholderiales bacterium PBB1]|nr:MAG: hypothetical protein CFE40_01655 [Burkholderiales bacterium PBB1]